VSSKIEIKIPSQMVFLGVPDAVLMELAGDLPFAQKEIDELSTSVIEACTNAMEHGNKLRDDHAVEVHFEFRDDEIEVTVLDHGPGFDFDNWRPPADVLVERGRGIMIMREFTDELSFDFAPDGRFRARLRKRFNGGQ
jgi:serine/threonine-protein kinase RsbW